MAEEKEKKETTPKENRSAAIPEEKFPVKDYLENAKALGYKEYVLAGAFYGLKEEDQLTKAEVEKKVKNFLGKKVV